MINMRTHDTGDLIIQFDVDFPTEKSLTPAQFKVIIREKFAYCTFSFVVFSANWKVFYRNDHMWRFRKENMLKKHI